MHHGLDDEMIDELAWEIATLGIDLVQERVDRFGRLAGSQGASPTLVGVLLDPAEPAVARLRAFARLAAWMQGRTRERVGHAAA